jgi:peptide/nickel transport system substrate-binding protein
MVIGLLPKHILGDVPVENLDFSEFNYLSPVGTGPYKVVSITNNGGTEKVALIANDHFYGAKSKITGINFYIFPSFTQLELS